MSLDEITPTPATPASTLFIDLAERPGGAIEVVAVGEFDLVTAGQLRLAVIDALVDANEVELDLSGVTFMDSTGLNALIGLLARLEDEQRMTIVRASSQVRRVLEVTELLAAFGLDAADD